VAAAVQGSGGDGVAEIAPMARREVDEGGVVAEVGDGVVAAGVVDRLQVGLAAAEGVLVVAGVMRGRAVEVLDRGDVVRHERRRIEAQRAHPREAIHPGVAHHRVEPVVLPGRQRRRARVDVVVEGVERVLQPQGVTELVHQREKVVGARLRGVDRVRIQPDVPAPGRAGLRQVGVRRRAQVVHDERKRDADIPHRRPVAHLGEGDVGDVRPLRQRELELDLL
jgi:hypothetical protein